MPVNDFLPPRNRAHPTYARAFPLMDRYEHLHPVMVTQLLEVPNTENVAADGPVACHHIALARNARHSRQHRLFRPSRLRPEEIATYCFQLIVSSAEPICTPPQWQNSSLRARLTFSSTGIFLSGGARTAFSRTMTSSSASSFCTSVCRPLVVRIIATRSYHLKLQGWRGTCNRHDGPDAGNGRQRA